MSVRQPSLEPTVVARYAVKVIEAAKAAGVDADRLLNEAGVPQATWSDALERVPMRDYAALWSAAMRLVGEATRRPVLGNASQLQQLFLNLCLNAIQAMEPGGELTVRVADLSEGGGNTLLVEVADSGPGIADELIPTIFDPFVTTKPHGTGLGLAICRSIADAHHARLTVRNNIGRPGCTFTVEFPVPAGRPARVAP